MNKNKVYKIILTKSLKEINLEILLEESYPETIKGIFESLYDLLKDYKQNKNKIEFLLLNLEKSMQNKTPTELESLAMCCLEFESKYQEEFSPKTKKQIVDSYKKIKHIEDTIYTKSPNVAKLEKTRLLEYLIFQDKDIQRIKILIENCPNIIKSPNCFNNIIIQLFNKISTIDIHSKQLEYYINITILLISKTSPKMIAKNKQQYLTILNSSPNKKEKFIKKIILIIKGEYKENIQTLENEYNIRINYPEELEHISYTYKPTKEKRTNLLEQNIITIDSTNTTRVDDGIYIQEDKDGGFTLYGHIADIPSIIPQFSIIDEVAKQRAENIYLSDNVIHIYPDFITCNLASLIPNNKRNVISYKIKLDDEMNPIFDKFEIELSKIAVKKKMDYQEVSSRLQKNNNSSYDKTLKLLLLYSLKNLKKPNIEVQYLLSHPDRLQEIIQIQTKKTSNGLGQLLIQEPMKTINYLNAKLANELEIPYLYKSYEKDTEGLKKLEEILKDNPEIFHDQKLITRLERSYTSSYYISTPQQFNGYECYSGSTDPLWKYSDAYNQYLIHKYLFGNINEEEIDFYRTNILAKQLNQTIKNNKEFQRAYEIEKSLIKKEIKLRKKVNK